MMPHHQVHNQFAATARARLVTQNRTEGSWRQHPMAARNAQGPPCLKDGDVAPTLDGPEIGRTGRGGRGGRPEAT